MERLSLVINPRAGSGRASAMLPALRDAFRMRGVTLDVHSTSGSGDATRIVRQQLRSGVPGVAVVGGDGTLGAAASGFFDASGAAVAEHRWLAPLPCGTGGDFRRCLAIPEDPDERAAHLLRVRPRSIDVGWLTFVGHDGTEQTRAFLNVASFGIGGEVDRIVNASPKWMGGRAAFLLATLRAMRTYRNARIRVRLDDGPSRIASVLNLAVANGQYFGGGMRIAPRASLDDGLFDVVAIERRGIWPQVALAPALYGGRVLAQPGITFARASRIRAEPLDEQPVCLDIDGESPGRLPAELTLRRRVLWLRA